MQGNDISTQLVASSIAVWVIQIIKKSKYFPWITAQTGRLNRVVAVVVSGLTAVGIHVTFDHSSGVLTISGLTAAGIVVGFGTWLKSFVMQELVYQGVTTKSKG